MAVTVDAHHRTAAPVPEAAAGTLCGAFQRTIAADPMAPALRAHGRGRGLTRAEYARAVAELAGGLHGLGIGRGDPVGLMLTNRPEFHLVDAAALHLGAIPFSLDTDAPVTAVEAVLQHAECEVVVCEPAFLETVSSAWTPSVRHVVLVGGPPTAGTVGLDQLRHHRQAGFDFLGAWQRVHPDDVATLVYEVGPAGRVGAVELTHANLMYVLDACRQWFPFRERGTCLSHLPHSRPAARVFGHYLQMVSGYALTTVGDPEQLVAAIARTRPTWLLGASQTWDRLASDLRDRLSGVAEAVAAVTRRLALAERGEWVGAELERTCERVDVQHLAAVRAELGLDRCDLLLTETGPAPTTHDLLHALGLPLAEFWGAPETSGLAALPPPGAIRVGSVGTALPGTEARIAADGELLVRGPHVMRGYRGDPVRTNEAVGPEGWLHTGRPAGTDDAGYLWPARGRTNTVPHPRVHRRHP
ncbi:AMP-binding protein [Pseudonocardia pini]|uniref:AMP-binding protein n=1 Tax=Pseudonocardia pini TaxID=2758030 RepID=UPI0015F058A7|nr:AMP-binding protein [Pseudonocardia pini]